MDSETIVVQLNEKSLYGLSVGRRHAQPDLAAGECQRIQP